MELIDNRMIDNIYNFQRLDRMLGFMDVKYLTRARDLRVAAVLESACKDYRYYIVSGLRKKTQYNVQLVSTDGRICESVLSLDCTTLTEKGIKTAVDFVPPIDIFAGEKAERLPLLQDLMCDAEVTFPLNDSGLAFDWVHTADKVIERIKGRKTLAEAIDEVIPDDSTDKEKNRVDAFFATCGLYQQTRWLDMVKELAPRIPDQTTEIMSLTLVNEAVAALKVEIGDLRAKYQRAARLLFSW